MDRQGFQSWLDRYVAAWKSYDEADIKSLFSDDCVYRYSPDPAEPAVYQGRDAIAQSWLESKDEPNTYDAKYEPLAVDGDTFVANGVTRYFNADGSQRDEFYNVYVCRFNEEGECATFTEYWMQNRKFRKACP